MSQLIWTPEALQDVQRLYRFLADKNIVAAKRAVQVIRESVTILARQPNVGRPVDEMDPEYREWLVNFGDSGYVALYRYHAQTAIILSIRHQKEAGY